jgi:hypothetical protein
MTTGFPCEIHFSVSVSFHVSFVWRCVDMSVFLHRFVLKTVVPLFDML